MLAASRAFGASPTLDDYSQGIAIVAPGGLPLVEATLPDAVYQGVTRADLGDVRVFNAEGQPVPHAFCSSPAAAEPTITEQALPVFQLREATPANVGGSRVEVQTAGGTQVNVVEAGSAQPFPANGRIHIIDARDSDEPVRAIQFEWQSPDGASQVQVRIEASDDLDRWHVLVPASTLLLATRGDQQLRRERIALPPQQYKYLRVQRTDGGPPLAINRVIAERVGAAVEIEPFWFMATTLVTDDIQVLFFDTARRAPVNYARLRLPQENSSVRVTLHSRDDGKAPWTRALERRGLSDRHRYGAARKSTGAVRGHQRSLLAPANREGSAALSRDAAGVGLPARAPALPVAGIGPVHARIRQPARGDFRGKRLRCTVGGRGVRGAREARRRRGCTRRARPRRR